jgi:hypothetical protein
MNYRSCCNHSILIGKKSSTSCLIARHLDEKSRDCKQKINIFPSVFPQKQSLGHFDWILDINFPLGGERLD